MHLELEESETGACEDIKFSVAVYVKTKNKIDKTHRCIRGTVLGHHKVQVTVGSMTCRNVSHHVNFVC